MASPLDSPSKRPRAASNNLPSPTRLRRRLTSARWNSRSLPSPSALEVTDTKFPHFKFALEFELQLRPLHDETLPSPDESPRVFRDYNLRLLQMVADCLSKAELSAKAHRLSDDAEIDYNT
ncbi:hypothetical protein HJFPF1_13382 [Paramyrothecium foliicola]|nr:hypothetical protein HJFPF1_13382 [Paramyrothecium foliicola]